MKAVCFAVALIALQCMTVEGHSHPNRRETQSITLEPWYGSILGGTAVVIRGPQFEESDDITCSFDGVTVECDYLDATSALCVSPLLKRIGLVEVEMFNYSTAMFYSLPVNSPVNAVNFSMSDVFEFGDTIDLMWSPASFVSSEGVEIDQESLSLDIKMYELGLDHDREVMLTEIALLAVNLVNSGTASVTVPSTNNGNSCRSQSSSASICSVVIFIGISEGRSGFFTSDAGLWTDVIYVSFKPPSTLANLQLEQCQEWVNSSSAAAGLKLLDRVSNTPCPPRVAQAEAVNSRLVKETSSNLLKFFHPGASSCFSQQIFTSSNQGSGNRCCYDGDGFLIVGPLSGGAVSKIAPSGAIRELEYWPRLLMHQVEDVLPFIWCCKGERAQCNLYYQLRPSDNGSRYDGSSIGLLYGDPHVVTFDQYQYTFNGKGEFYLLKTENSLFTLQGRMTEAINQNGGDSLATVCSAIVIKQESSDTVQLEMISDTVTALVNGDSISFDVLKTWQLDNVTIRHNGDNTITVVFSGGALVQAQGRNGLLSQILVSLPETYRGVTSGLLGSYNNDREDDLMPQNSNNPISSDSTTAVIHTFFGTSWVATEDESLFTYLDGQSWNDFNSSFTPVFEAVFTDSSLEATANTLCGDDQYCLFDVAATERLDIGEATKETGASYQELISFSTPVSCEPSCVFGVCVASNTCAC